MIATIAIAVAAVLGSVVGAFFEARLMALLWSTPLVALTEGVILLIAPAVRQNEQAPPWLRQGVAELADPKLLVLMSVASATGTLVAWALINYVRSNRSTPYWLPSMEPVGARKPRRTAAPEARPGKMLDRRIDRLNAPKPPRRAAAWDPGQIYEVAPAAPPRSQAEPAAAPVPRPPRPAGAEKRRHTRRRGLLAGRLFFGDDRSMPCTIQNLSVSGAQVRLASPAEIPGSLWLLDVSNGLVHAAQVAWRREPSLGLRFRESFDLHSSQDPRVRALRAQWTALVPR